MSWEAIFTVNYKDVTAHRADKVYYQNLSGKPLVVAIRITPDGNMETLAGLYVSDDSIGTNSIGTNSICLFYEGSFCTDHVNPSGLTDLLVHGIIPIGKFYQLDISKGNLNWWHEG